MDTLKLIAHMRDIRDGKGEQKQFYSCVKWLAKHHPLTLTSNLSHVVQVRQALKKHQRSIKEALKKR